MRRASPSWKPKNTSTFTSTSSAVAYGNVAAVSGRCRGRMSMKTAGGGTGPAVYGGATSARGTTPAATNCEQHQSDREAHQQPGQAVAEVGFEQMVSRHEPAAQVGQRHAEQAE